MSVPVPRGSSWVILKNAATLGLAKSKRLLGLYLPQRPHAFLPCLSQQYLASWLSLCLAFYSYKVNLNGQVSRLLDGGYRVQLMKSGS